MVTLALINKNLFLQISSCSTSDSMDPGCNLIEFFVKVYLFGRRPSSREAGEQLLNKKMTKRALLEYFSILQISILISFGHPFQSSVLSWNCCIFWLFSAGLLQNLCKNTESLYKYRIFVEPEIVFPLLRHKWYLSQNHSYGWETFPHLHHHTYKDPLNTFTNNWNVIREVLNSLDFFRT